MPDKTTSCLIPVIGANFSGRSQFLKALGETTALISSSGFLYLGEQPSNYLSGIFPTVEQEFELHATGSDQATLQKIKDLLKEFDLSKHFNRNPFTLSGGEQTMLLVLLNLLLNPEILAIDSTIEQLDSDWRSNLFHLIRIGAFPLTRFYLADNRVDEYELGDLESITPVNKISDSGYEFGQPQICQLSHPPKPAQAIKLKKVSFNYPLGETVLADINIQLEPGIIYNLKGRNGSGKSTLAKLITGILKLTKGQILVDDQIYNSYERPGRLAGYSFQNPDDQLFALSVENEVLAPLKKESAEYHTRREDFLKMFGLLSVRKMHPGELPFVMRKRIALAAALATDNPWVILDEPTLGQDSLFVDFLIELLHTLAEQGRGIIVISHSKNFAKKLTCKTLTLISNQIRT